MRGLFLLPILAAAQTYTADIAPLLDKRCGGCHGGEAKMGEFSINTFDLLLRGGNHGKTVISGKPEDSLLYQMVTGKAYPTMPMDGTTLSKGELDLLHQWITKGAKGPEPGEKQTVRSVTVAPRIAPRAAVKPQVFAMAWQPSGNLLALAGFQKVTLVEARTGKTVSTLPGHAEAVRNVAFSRDGKLLAAAGGLCGKQGEVRIYNVDTRAEVGKFNGHDDCIYGLAFSPDGKMLATSSYDKLIKLWDTATGQEIRMLKDHIDSVYALEFTPDGKRLISGAADRTVKIWDPATGKRLYTLSEPLDGINTLAVDPSGHYVAAGGIDKSIRVWRIGAISGELVHSLMAHEDAILKIVWSPDGKSLVSSSADRSIKVLKAEDLSEAKLIPNQSDWVYGLQFSPDGRQLAVGRMDGSLSLYDSVQFKDALVRAQR